MNNPLIKILLATLSSFLLSSCKVPVYHTQYTFIQPKTVNGKQCTSWCASTQSDCELHYQQDRESCQTEANLNAMPQYMRYVQYQNAHNKPVIYQVTNFADYSQCEEKYTCKTDYRSCFKGCGGEVVATQNCIANCDKK